MKTVEDWIADYVAGRGKPRGVPEMGLGYGVASIEAARKNPELWTEHTAHLTIIGMFLDGRLKQEGQTVTLRKMPAGERESVTPRHIKPLLPEMRSGNICEMCGKAFETARRHAATCSAACRKAKSRQKKNG
jgi:hypothetical protein